MRISDWSSDVCSSDLKRSSPLPLRERLRPRAFALAPPPAKAGGGREGVPTVRADPKDTHTQPSPAFAGEGAEKIAAEAAPATACCCHADDSASSASTCSASYFGVASVLSSSIASTGTTHEHETASRRERVSNKV